MTDTTETGTPATNGGGPFALLEPELRRLYELLYPEVSAHATAAVYVQAADGHTTGALLANEGDVLTLRAVGTEAVHVTNHELELTCIVHLSSLVGRVERD